MKLNVKRLFNRPLSVSLVMGLVVLLIYKGLELVTGWFIDSIFLKSVFSGGIAMAAGGVVYYLLMIAAKGITAEDIKSLPRGKTILSLTSKIPCMEKFLK